MYVNAKTSLFIYFITLYWVFCRPTANTKSNPSLFNIYKNHISLPEWRTTISNNISIRLHTWYIACMCLYPAWTLHKFDFKCHLYISELFILAWCDFVVFIVCCLRVYFYRTMENVNIIFLWIFVEKYVWVCVCKSCCLWLCTGEKY